MLQFYISGNNKCSNDFNVGQVTNIGEELLGHFDIKTTERYLHISKQKLVNIVSLLDDLVRN